MPAPANPPISVCEDDGIVDLQGDVRPDLADLDLGPTGRGAGSDVGRCAAADSSHRVGRRFEDLRQRRSQA